MHQPMWTVLLASLVVLSCILANGYQVQSPGAAGQVPGAPMTSSKPPPAEVIPSLILGRCMAWVLSCPSALTDTEAGCSEGTATQAPRTGESALPFFERRL